MKEAIIKEICRDDSKLKDTAAGDANGKKKRVRINKEKVDINNASNFQRGGNDRGHAGAQQGQGARPQGGNQPGGNNANITATAIRTASRSRSSSRRLARKM